MIQFKRFEFFPIVIILKFPILVLKIVQDKLDVYFGHIKRI
jgi:hypothetical protein